MLVLDPTGCLLLFRFVHKHGALAGHAFWATPGGGLEPGETFAEAAIRELKEETGIAILIDCGNGIGRQMVKANIPLSSLRTIFITHQHSDHNADYGMTSTSEHGLLMRGVQSLRI